MAHFYISAVKMDDSRQHIQWVKLIKAGKNSDHATVNSRQFVAELISEGAATFQTITKGSDGQWVYGATVHDIDGVYITTDANKTKRDNLGNLPEF